jgi:hypothetical protein
MSSLGDIQQTYQLCQQIYALMNKIEEKTESTDRKIRASSNDVRQYLTVLSGIATIARRMAGTEDQKALIDMFAHGIHVAMMLRMQWRLLQTELGPVGIMMLAIGAVGTAMSIGDMAGQALGVSSEVY